MIGKKEKNVYVSWNSVCKIKIFLILTKVKILKKLFFHLSPSTTQSKGNIFENDTHRFLVGLDVKSFSSEHAQMAVQNLQPRYIQVLTPAQNVCIHTHTQGRILMTMIATV